MKENYLNYTELKRLVEPDERSDHLAVTSIYLKELHAVARQNLVVATQESIQNELRNLKRQEETNNPVEPNYFHQTNAKKRKTYSCSFVGCNRIFKWLAHYKYHRKTHLGAKAFKCHFENCNRCFYTAQSLAVHRTTHTGEKNYVCPATGCTRRFNTNGNLKNHIRVHSREKPFSCNNEGCEMSFAELSSLKKHSLVHSGQKPYICDICDRRFSQISSRNLHKQRTHIEDAAVDKPQVVTSNNHQLLENVSANSVMMSNQNSEDTLSVRELRDDCVILSQPVTTNSCEVQHPYSDQSECLGVTNVVAELSKTKVLVLSEREETVLIANHYMEDYSDSDTINDAIVTKIFYKS